ncbi:MAG TPA: hypothetical protein VHW09_09850 [Bryobacteraceae bacterium]|jgi:hypothetical protein|nr:hypothetical protein [Bryobacteraceae bacterium]
MPAPAAAGLCATCTHARTVTSDRGAIFTLCGLSKTDPHFPKYPRLPVLACTGWTPEGTPPTANA